MCYKPQNQIIKFLSGILNKMGIYKEYVTGGFKMNFLALAAATETAAQPNTMASLLATFLPLVFAFILFYFLLIRPQKKQQKQHAATLATVEAGDSVLTASGFYGVVIDVTDDIVIVEFGNNKNCRIPMKKEAISEVEKAKSE